MIFGGVYEVFSHGVYSMYMIYAFAFPLIGGALPAYAAVFSGKELHPGRASYNLWNSAVAAFTAGSILKGVLEIYGTTNSITAAYWVIGVIFAVSAVVLQLFGLRKRKINTEAAE